MIAADQPIELSPGTHFGPYRIVARIGAGGMGVIYRARDSRLDRDVAIKLIHPGLTSEPERISRFEQEARATGRLNHPNILSVFDVGTHDGAPFIVSELLEGSTLRERLTSGPFRGRKALAFAKQVADGLVAAHEKGVVHRDLKPENLFLTADGRAKILDFGLAKLTEAQFSRGSDTHSLENAEIHTGKVTGTAGYMAPEQARGERADMRSDIFSLGAILFEMYSGRRAFARPSVVETLHAILKDDPPDVELTEVPLGLEAIMRHCLEKNPADRFQTAKDLAFSLESIGEAAVITSTRSGQPAPHLSFRTAAAGATAVAVLVLAGIAGARIYSFRNVPHSLPKYTRLTFRQGNISDARFGPDGRTVFYGAAWDAGPMTIYQTRIDGPDARPVGLPAGSIFSVSPQGILAISRGCDLNMSKCRGTLAEVSIAGGAPRDIAEDVDWADWSPDGKDLAIVRAVGGFYRLEYPIGRVLYQSPGWISNPRVSPDGNLVAFADHPDLGLFAGSVAVVDRRGTKTILSDGWKMVFGLAWRSNDELWFNGSRLTRTGQLWGIRLDKSERQILSSAGYFEIVDIAGNGRALFFRTNIRTRSFVGSATDERELGWFDWSIVADLSDDGKTILFYESGDGARGSPQVYLRSTDGADAIRLGEGRALDLSSDEKWALAVVGVADQQLVLLPTGAGQARQLPRGNLVEFYSASFFPDNRRILVSGETKEHVPLSSIIDRTDGSQKALGGRGVSAVLVAPDGKHVAAYGPDGTFYLFSIDGTAATPIPGLAPGDRLVQWSEDGRELYVRGPGDDSVDIDRLDLASGRRVPWKHIVPADRVGMIGVEDQGVCITRDGNTYAYSYWTVLQDLYSVEGLQ
ncbi:MAG: WD40 repeat domain-containing serine/threonine protein kinase [Acidobacteriota bacterium]